MAKLSNILTGQSNLVTDQDLAAIATTGSYSDLTNKPNIFSGSYTDLTNKPTLFSGSYADLTNKPTLATVATSGSYADLSNKPVVISLKGTSVTYPGDDLAADPAGAQTILITGTGFESTPTVYIGGTIAPSVTFVSATQITVTTPAKAAGTYDIYIVNPGGATAIMVMAISYSGTPAWTTAAGSLGTLESDWTVQLQATSNSAVTYALTNGSTFPSGITLSSSGLITGTGVSSEQTFNFSVTATDAELQDTSRSFSVTISLGEPYFRYTTLLLGGNGSNAAQNNTFLDSSSNNRTITRNGNVTQGTFSPYGPNWSNCFIRGSSQGENSSISFPNNDAYKFGSGDFTIEAWVNPSNKANGEYYIIAQCAETSSWTNGWTVYILENQLGFWSNDTGQVGGTVPIGVWTHIAVSRQGTTIRLFVNGTIVNTYTSSHNFVPTRALSVGAEPLGGYAFPSNTFISNLRVVKGTAVYTNNFVSPNEPLTAISGTSLLLCQSNRIVDKSPIAATPAAPNVVVTNPWPSVQRFNPFGAVTSYSASTIGGSGYFDGANGNLSATVGTIGTGAFTFECWLYNTVQNNQPIFALGSYDSGIDVRFDQITSGVLSGYIANTGYIFVSNPIRNQWIHFALTRDSGNTVRAFYNGALTFTQAGVTANVTDTTLNIGNLVGGGVGGNQRYTGYMSDFRYVIGTAVYTSAFTPPTAPLTAISGTNLLCKFTNASIIDNAMMNDLETVGNTQISTSVKKYGTGSLYFDGTGDYLSIASNPNLALGSGDFTVECWIYATAASDSPIYESRNSGSGSAGFTLTALNSSVIRIFTGTSSFIASSGTNYLNIWTHVAVVRSGATTTLYINGTSAGSATGMGNLTDQSTLIGGGRYSGGVGTPSAFFTGYIDDFRITKGYARYTANFTPPTTAFNTR
jgi:hypothetical protein